ncbi:MAG: hypothetical protein IJH38_05430 [Clostridia bacterium]|nr:hypothetical protein [Clostridia bacterium]
MPEASRKKKRKPAQKPRGNGKLIAFVAGGAALAVAIALALTLLTGQNAPDRRSPAAAPAV